MPVVADMSLGDEGWVTIIHELGHAVGLKHPFEDAPVIDAALDSNQYTVMSYSAHPATDQIWPITPMLYDIQALQALYGANMQTRSGDTVYLGSTPGSIYSLADNDAMILTIWDGGGRDAIDASNQTFGVSIDLNAGHFSSVGSLTHNLAIAFGVTIEDAKGGRGHDQLIGNGISNLLVGGGGNDTLNGGGGNDTAGYGTAVAGITVSLAVTGAQATGGAGSDTLTSIENLNGSNFADTLTGNGLANVLAGGAGSDTVSGGGGSDSIVGALGADRLIGNESNDTLRGQDGNDTIFGGFGNDQLWGGTGADVFVLNVTLNATTSVDSIQDFSAVDDTIQLARTVFTQVGALGALTAGAFRVGSAAGDSSDRIIYQASTGSLFYDSDGTGAAGQIRFAVLAPGTALGASDFVIV